MDNYQDVVHQMEQFGIEFKSRDLPLHIDLPKRKTCGLKGKDWYKLYTFRPRAGGTLILGRFGTYRHGGSSQRVDVDWQPLSDAEKARLKAERDAAAAAAQAERAKEVALAAMDALSHWRSAAKQGTSDYLKRKGVEGESCRYIPASCALRWPGREPGEDDTVVYLPKGTLVLPLIRFDKPRDEALRGVQFIRPDGAKIYLRGFDKPGCALRLGDAVDLPALAMVCEGYATGLTIRAATDWQYPVYVAFDAGNLVHVVPIVRELLPNTRILLCADDDYKTFDRQTGQLTNPGRTTARKVAKDVAACDLVWPVFNAATRGDKDTDFNDLHLREGLAVAQRQLQGTIHAMAVKYG